MKRALFLAALIILLAAPLASAGGVTYHPDRAAFREFLTSDSTYRVVGGNESWARGWAYYIDEKLDTIKGHGDGVLVLVGNVKNNRLMAEVWNRTGLPAEESFHPSVIILNDTVLITGSKDNIYLTELAFRELWNPPLSSVLLSSLLALAIVTVFLTALTRDGKHAGSFYLLTVSLFVLWYLTGQRPAPTEGFLHQFLQALSFTKGGPPESPLSVIMGLVFRVIPPIEENLVFIHWILVLLVISCSFCIAPRRFREMGFIIFGLTFVAPMFREEIGTISGGILGLASFIAAVAIISNVTFSPEKGKALAQTVILSAFTLLATAINPYLALTPLVFVLVFPKRYLRNYTYLALTALGVFLMYVYLGFPPHIPQGMDPNGPVMVRRFLLNSGLALATAGYAVTRREVKIKGQTAFFLLATAVYLPLSLFVPSLLPYCFVLLAGLVVRLLYGFTPGT
ncbi:hypothetical protein E3E36_04460 [Thermococcus sp. M36]|uniref:hypothetical protein n=1 Tax=Thermococcus sp. M36 TaxID=1638261 RepID=UPI0014387F8B|nr:hypothetical protein [Thermococcus sp. M36]NJE05406.1 hypothetical protein [Thermococcus sp. M36]